MGINKESEGKRSLRPGIIEFNKIFEQSLPFRNSIKETYKLAEAIWMFRTGTNKYKNFGSFRRARQHYWKHIRKVKH